MMKCYNCDEEVKSDEYYSCIDCQNVFDVECFSVSTDRCWQCHFQWESNLKYQK